MGLGHKARDSEVYVEREKSDFYRHKRLLWTKKEINGWFKKAVPEKNWKREKSMLREKTKKT